MCRQVADPPDARRALMLRRRSPRAPLTGEITVPGDKSISHRALIIGALADGRSRASGANTGDDIRATAAVLSALGARCELMHNGRVDIEGCGLTGFREPEDVLDCGNSGTTLRTLLGVCAAVDGISVLTGDASLRRRPMLRVVAPLRQMGARIDGRRHGDLAPLVVRGGTLTGAEVETRVASAQVKTALLIAGLFADGGTRVVEPAKSRDHTERMLAHAGVSVQVEGTAVAVAAGERPRALDRRIPGDLSSAMFLVGAALLVPGSDLVVRNVGLNPTRTGALTVLERMGADLVIEVEDEWGGEPVGSVRARACDLRGVRAGGDAVPSFVDEVPLLAVAAARAEGETVLTGASELRVKESDRIAAIVAGLRILGADAEELPDGLVVRGPAELGGGDVDARDDHRIAMAFAVAGLVAQDSVQVRGWSSVETSFPEFLDVLAEAQRKK